MKNQSKRDVAARAAPGDAATVATIVKTEANSKPKLGWQKQHIWLIVVVNVQN